MAYRPTEKTKAKKATQRQKVLNAAITLVSESGFQSLKINEIAARADISTGSVYKHFASKEELCKEVFKACTVKEVEKVQEAASNELVSHTERLLNSIETFSKRALKAKQMAYALIAEPIDTAVDKERLAYRQAYADIYSQLIQSGIIAGEFPSQIPSISAAAIVGTLAEALVGPLAKATQDNETIDQDRLITSIKKFCKNAVSP